MCSRTKRRAGITILRESSTSTSCSWSWRRLSMSSAICSAGGYTASSESSCSATCSESRTMWCWISCWSLKNCPSSTSKRSTCSCRKCWTGRWLKLSDLSSSVSTASL
eukprot:Amastigsp_a8083_12.p4 type:complete len:108 gc:universal Amastigsp_a8083_12:491-168(-)